MPSSGDLMRKALKKGLLPQLASLGFSGKASEFRRNRESVLDLVSIQWGRYGGEFILEFGSSEAGPMKTSWGEIVPEEKITVAHLSVMKRARLAPLTPSPGLQLHGFFFGDFGEDIAEYDKLAKSVSAMLVQVVSWLEDGSIGPNVRPFKTVA